jgi:hypothetical protein
LLRHALIRLYGGHFVLLFASTKHS